MVCRMPYVRWLIPNKWIGAQIPMEYYERLSKFKEFRWHMEHVLFIALDELFKRSDDEILDLIDRRTRQLIKEGKLTVW